MEQIGIGLERYKKPKVNKNLHSKEHVLAEEISKAFGEPKMFARYLGTIKRVGYDRANYVYRDILDQGTAKTPGKLFFWKLKKQVDNPQEKGCL